MSDEQVVLGCVGRLLVGTRGPDGQGEVLLRVRGGTEAYLAWSDERLAKGASVLVVGLRAPRTVEVVPWDGALPPLPAMMSNIRKPEPKSVTPPAEEPGTEAAPPTTTDEH